mmetsp:Transcript_10795/g.19519  ORF Transcript_10795/g.19519 Transcript_10795/m.19519 type:complete len:701 (-) Transcript_10795:39-2141(-)
MPAQIIGQRRTLGERIEDGEVESFVRNVHRRFDRLNHPLSGLARENRVRARLYSRNLNSPQQFSFVENDLPAAATDEADAAPAPYEDSETPNPRAEIDHYPERIRYQHPNSFSASPDSPRTPIYSPSSPRYSPASPEYSRPRGVLHSMLLREMSESETDVSLQEDAEEVEDRNGHDSSEEAIDAEGEGVVWTGNESRPEVSEYSAVDDGSHDDAEEDEEDGNGNGAESADDPEESINVDEDDSDNDVDEFVDAFHVDDDTEILLDLEHSEHSRYVLHRNHELNTIVAENSSEATTEVMPVRESDSESIPNIEGEPSQVNSWGEDAAEEYLVENGDIDNVFAEENPVRSVWERFNNQVEREEQWQRSNRLERQLYQPPLPYSAWAARHWPNRSRVRLLSEHYPSLTGRLQPRPQLPGVLSASQLPRIGDQDGSDVIQPEDIARSLSDQHCSLERTLFNSIKDDVARTVVGLHGYYGFLLYSSLQCFGARDLQIQCKPPACLLERLVSYFVLKCTAFPLQSGIETILPQPTSTESLQAAENEKKATLQELIRALPNLDFTSDAVSSKGLFGPVREKLALRLVLDIFCHYYESTEAPFYHTLRSKILPLQRKLYEMMSEANFEMINAKVEDILKYTGFRGSLRVLPSRRRFLERRLYKRMCCEAAQSVIPLYSTKREYIRAVLAKERNLSNQIEGLNRENTVL